MMATSLSLAARTCCCDAATGFAPDSPYAELPGTSSPSRGVFAPALQAGTLALHERTMGQASQSEPLYQQGGAITISAVERFARAGGGRRPAANRAARR